MRVVSWQVAVKLVYEERVETLASYDEKVSSPSVTWRIPAVIRHKRQTPRRSARVTFSRANIYLRDNYECQYCGKKFSSGDLTLDHVVPRSQGGPRTWENIVTACRRCNSTKANLSCDDAGMFPLREPRIPLTLPLVPKRFGVPSIPIQWIPFLEGWA
jgi:5-methylcytosine-specific restriction endonuclease McrA